MPGALSSDVLARYFNLIGELKVACNWVRTNEGKLEKSDHAIMKKVGRRFGQLVLCLQY